MQHLKRCATGVGKWLAFPSTKESSTVDQCCLKYFWGSYRERKAQTTIYTSHHFHQLAINMKLLFIKPVCVKMSGKMIRDTGRRVLQCELDDLVSRTSLNELCSSITFCKHIPVSTGCAGNQWLWKGPMRIMRDKQLRTNFLCYEVTRSLMQAMDVEVGIWWTLEKLWSKSSSF